MSNGTEDGGPIREIGEGGKVTYKLPDRTGSIGLIMAVQSQIPSCGLLMRFVS